MERFTAAYGWQCDRGGEKLGIHKVVIWSDAYGNARLMAEVERPKDMYLLGVSRIEAAASIDNVMLRTLTTEDSTFLLSGCKAWEEVTEALIGDLSEIFGQCAYEPSERGAGIAFTDSIGDEVSQLLNDHQVTFRGD